MPPQQCQQCQHQHKHLPDCCPFCRLQLKTDVICTCRCLVAAFIWLPFTAQCATSLHATMQSILICRPFGFRCLPVAEACIYQVVVFQHVILNGSQFCLPMLSENVGEGGTDFDWLTVGRRWNGILFFLILSELTGNQKRSRYQQHTALIPNQVCIIFTVVLVQR